MLTLTKNEKTVTRMRISITFSNLKVPQNFVLDSTVIDVLLMFSKNITQDTPLLNYNELLFYELPFEASTNIFGISSD